MKTCYQNSWQVQYII